MYLYYVKIPFIRIIPIRSSLYFEYSFAWIEKMIVHRLSFLANFAKPT
jgi:hypothetical protein